MIAFIRGTLVSCTSDTIVVDHQGIGWQIAYPHTEKLHIGSEVMVHTYLHITENDMSLYGFDSVLEKEFFLRLIGVKGLGPKTAMNMLARADYNHLINSIENGDLAVLKSMPGIGAKTAGQIILDLKGKLVQVDQDNTKYSIQISEACDALKNLGYRQGEITSAAKKMNEQAGLKTEEYIRIGLQFLMKQRNGG